MRRQARYFTEPLIAALSQMEWTREQVERLTASASTDQAPAPIPTNWARERRRLAEDFGERRISKTEFEGQLDDLTENERLERDDRQRIARAATNTSDTRDALSDFAALVAEAKGDRQQKLWAILASHYFERFEHLGENEIRPVPNARGAQAFIAATMPTRVVLARPEGFEPPTC